jgi:hypothetical protein
MATVSKSTPQSSPQTSQADDWSLTTDQMIFMLQYHNPVEAAYAADNMAYLQSLAASDDYKAIFGDMNWDEAYDRYEEMLTKASDADSPMVS